MFVAFDIPVSSLTPRSLSVTDNRESLTTVGLGSEVPPAISALRNPAKTLPAGQHTRLDDIPLAKPWRQRMQGSSGATPPPPPAPRHTRPRQPQRRVALVP